MKFLFEENEKGDQALLVNAIDTGIEISNRYGFLSIKFKNTIEKNKFITEANIEYEIEDFNNHKLIHTRWLSEDYPCRVYFSGNKLILSFYDKEGDFNESEIFDNRIIVFKNILKAIINLKVLEALESIKDNKR